MKVQEMMVTPEMAEKWLGKNTRNRKLRPAIVDMLAAVIKRGEWEFNGETIKLNNDIVVDGQHRLAAIVKAGKAVRSLVATGVPSDAIITIDTGVRRSLGDFLAMRGEAQAQCLATTLTWAFRFKTGTGGRMGMRPTIHQALDILKAEPNIRKIPPQADKWYRAFPDLAKSIYMGAYYRLQQVDQQDAFEFMNLLANGHELKPSSPLIALRQRLIKNRASKAKLNDSYILALLFKTWNAWRTGSELGALRWVYDGPNGEQFPTPE